MDGRDRTNSIAMKGLLGRQLASITDTLAKASQRRDAELQRRTAPKPPVAPAIQTPPVLSPNNPSLTSDTEGTGSDSGDSIVFGGHQKGPNIQGFEFGRLDLELTQANSILGDDTAKGSLQGGYVSDDEDPKKMFARFECFEPSTGTYDKNDPTQMLAHLDRISPAAGAYDENDPKKMLAEMAQIDAARHARSEQSDNDVISMLARLNKTSTVGESTCQGEVEDNDPKKMLAALGHSTSSNNEATVHVDEVDNPKKMLAELEADSNDDPRKMLACLEQGMALGTQEPVEANNDDLEALHGRLVDMIPPPIDHRSPSPEATHAQLGNCEFDPALTSYVIAIQLENTGFKWEEAQGWTTYLFSNGLDGYKARQEKDRILQQATEELDEIIQQVSQEEGRYLSTENRARLPCRLIVSNIAADAGEEELKEFFYPFRFLVQELKVLPDRHPIRRTKVAHIDMLTRPAAIRASYMTGNIFGLLLDIRLAVEKGD